MELRTLFLALLFLTNVALVAQVNSSSNITVAPSGFIKAKPKPVGFDLKKSKIILSVEHIEAYNKLQVRRLSWQLQKLTGKISSFKDESFNKKLSVLEIDSLSIIEKVVQIPNPDNPNDIYDLIDTIIKGYPNPWKAFGFRVNTEKNYLEKVFSRGKSIFYKWDEVSKLITAEQVAFLKGLEYFGIEEITDNTVSTVSQSVFNAFSTTIYNLGIDGKAKMYNSLYFDREQTVNEILVKEKLRLHLSIPNPENPEDIYDLIDTTVYISYSDTPVKKIKIYHTWDEENGSFKVSVFAFAPMFVPEINDVRLKPTNLFILTNQDVKTKVNLNLYEYINYVSIAVLRNQGTELVNPNAVFQDLE